MHNKQDRIKTIFWCAFVALPLFTGFLQYDWLPEEYDERRHDLIKSHSVECGMEGMQSCDVPDVWEDRKSGKVYHATDFKNHNRVESFRLAILSFLYGLIACLFHVWDRKKSGDTKSPWQLFKQALLINAIAATVIFAVI